MEEFKNTEEYINYMIDNGYMASDLEPLKCHKCENTQFEEFGHQYIAGHTCEYGVKCKNCGVTVGYWAYGYWTP